MGMEYRPEVDGLRAIAVIPVILFHAGFEFVSGGYVGVDIFFVVSGYLITNIIYNEIQNNSFSIIKFYERRARRILPALFFVSLISILLAWIWMLPKEFEELSRSLIAVNLFISNIYFATDMGYFAGAAEMKPFLHTWSLAVEEQFYLFFPLVMMVLGTLKRRYLLFFVFVVFVISLTIAEWASTRYTSYNFYLLPSRVWELMAGAIIAIYCYKKELNFPKFFCNLGAFFGLGLIFYSIVAFDEDTPFPSLWAIFPVLGASLVILFARVDNTVGKLLSLKPIVGIGLISYSAYLWHQPVFVFARERSLESLTHFDFLLLSLLSLILAYFSWKFIEQPFRNKKRFTRSQIFSGAFAISILMLSFGAYGIYSKGIPNRLDEEVARIANVRNDRHLQSEGCQSTPSHTISIKDSCEYNEDYSKKVVVWGDSQATPLVGPVAKKFEELNMGVKQFVYTNCLPIAGYSRSDRPACGKFNNEVLNSIVNDKNIEIVFMLGRYPLQLEGKSFDNLEGGVEEKHKIYAVPIENIKSKQNIHDKDRIEAVGKLIKETVNTLIDNGVKVVLIYPVPEAGWDVPSLLAKEKLYGIERNETLSISYDVFRKRTKSSYEQLDLIENHKNLIKIRPEFLFCNTRLPDRCITQIGGRLLYYDSNHLSRYGANILINHIFSEIKKSGWLRKKQEEIEDFLSVNSNW
ncbi:acyltransferase family protein [Halomonas sp. PR-M31]|uniref:acyltransferase family protein n=1 Tax=Halomonas sp. PR-M31 TaxID=1471202 RepID=UPI000AF259FC|nr:acyltransferase family protein [Halomonas sp. PR-M31]